MAAIRDRVRKSPDDGEGESQSMAQQHLQLLLRKQLHTKGKSVETLKNEGKKFTEAVEFKPLAAEVEGLQSLQHYLDTEKEHNKIDELRDMGLTTEEIKLVLDDDYDNSDLPTSSAKRRKLFVEPNAQRERMKAIEEKIISREELLKQPVVFSDAHVMSRHAMEVERSVHQDKGNPLTYLTLQDSTQHILYPKSVIPDDPPSKQGVQEVSLKQADSSGDVEDSSSCSDCVLALPAQVVDRNRLTVAEIRALPRFRDYCTGEPSSVLYLKNLHHSVSVEDLHAVFMSVLEDVASGSSGRYGEEVDKSREDTGIKSGTPYPRIRLMTGRMRGQAFVEFASKDSAVQALGRVNGFVMKGKPVIISFGKKK